MNEPKPSKSPETQRDVFRGAHRAKDGVPSASDEATRDQGDSAGQPTEAPGAGFPDRAVKAPRS